MRIVIDIFFMVGNYSYENDVSVPTLAHEVLFWVVKGTIDFGSKILVQFHRGLNHSWGKKKMQRN
ncbi:MAG: hypothetical protein QQN53_08350 [Nitrosopumilus sp.]